MRSGERDTKTDPEDKRLNHDAQFISSTSPAARDPSLDGLDNNHRLHGNDRVWIDDSAAADFAG